MQSRLLKGVQGTLSLTKRGLLVALGLLSVGGCGERADRQQTSGEFLLVYSGDFRGFFEPCG